MNSDLAEECAHRIEKLLESCHELYGAEWSKIVADYTPIIQQVMGRLNTQNPMQAAILLAQSTESVTQNKIIFLAIAAEISIQQKATTPSTPCLPH
jgi:hypothetical protein